MTPKHRSPKSPGLLSRRVASGNNDCLTKTSLFLSDQSLRLMTLPCPLAGTLETFPKS
jgi:hypothetical protein